MKKTSIIIVTWNSARVLADCVSSLYAHLDPDGFELILVDNGSEDESYLESFERKGNVRVLRNGENLGFSRAVNAGASVATGEYLLVLNPDTLFVSNPIPRLLRELEADSRIGVIGPLLHGADGRPQIEDFYPRFPSLAQYLLLRSFLAYLPACKRLAVRHFHARIDGPPGVRFVEQIPGAFLLFRRDLFGGEPPLDEAYFIWMEDVAFCRRVHDMGMKVAVVTDEKIIHVGGTSFKAREHSWKRRMFVRSYLTYLRLHFPPAGYMLHAAVMALNSLAIMILYPFTHARRGFRYVRHRVKVEGSTLLLIVADMAARIRRAPPGTPEES